MASQLNSRLLSFYRNVSRLASGVVLAVGFLVLMGWLLDIPILTSMLPGKATMKANSALGFILCGISLWSVNHKQTEKSIRPLGKAFAAVAVLIATLTLGEYVSNRDFGIDQLLIPDAAAVSETSFPGRMSPATALNLLLLGCALLLIDNRWSNWLNESLTITALMIASVAVIGYIYRVSSLYQIGVYASMALHTAVTFILLCLGILSARPERGLISILSTEGVAGTLARRLLPAAIGLPIVLGWLILSGQRIGHYDTAFGIALFALLNVIIFSGLIRWNADMLHQAVTEREQVEEKLIENEERYSRFFENMHEIFVVQEIVTDDDGKPIDLRFVDVNPAAEHFLGKTRDEIVGQTRSQLSGQPDPEGVEMASRVASTGSPFHMIRYSAGFGSWFESFTYSLGSGIVATLSLNVTERKEAEAALQRMNEELEQRVGERTAELSQANILLQMLLDYMPDQIYFKDAQSRFIRNSRSQANALGLNDPAEAVGKSDFDFFPHAQQSFEIEQEIIRSGKPLVDQEERVVWPDGKETWVSTTKVPLRDQAGQIIGTFGISRDITERKRSEIAYQKAKLELEAANKELEAFSYSVSHDLRAPLRSIDGFSQALLEDYGELLPPDGSNFLERIRSSAQRMAQLIDDLLNLSRVTRALIKSVPVDLTKLAESITSELQRTHPERDVRLSIAPNLNVRGDPQLLQVVLENFLSNAWKFTSKREDPKIEVGSKHENDEIIYFVRDNGAGFDMTYASKLFGAFQRLHSMTEFPGTGVGLATVQRIIHRHGGRVWAEAAVGEGATFFFTLPPLERTRPQAEPIEIEKDSLARRVKEII